MKSLGSHGVAEYKSRVLLRFDLFVDVDFLFFSLILYDLQTMYPNTPTIIILGRTDDGKVEIEHHLSDRHTTGRRQNPGRYSVPLGWPYSSRFQNHGQA